MWLASTAGGDALTARQSQQDDETSAGTERRIARTTAARQRVLPRRRPRRRQLAIFRGPSASGVADDQRLPDRWDGKSGRNILWRPPIAGLAHSSPIVNRRPVEAAELNGNLRFDLQPGMLDLLRNGARAGLSNVTAVLGTATDPNLPPDSVDLALMVDVYHELSQPQTMLRRLRTRSRREGAWP